MFLSAGDRLFSTLVLSFLFRLFLVQLVPLRVLSFNVDTSAPLVKRGTSGTYFGFSIAPHKIGRRDGRNQSDIVILVGAPRDNVTDPSAAESVRSITRPGVVYSCPLTSDPTDCSQLPIGREEPEEKEDRNDQWMGGTVASQGTETGAALVCAHRYKKFGPSFRWGLGWCISLYNSLQENQFWEPCAGKPTGQGHSEYGYCQAGTSAAISQEGEIVLGAPGPYNWRGAIFANSLHDVFQTWHQSPVEDERPSRANINHGATQKRQKKPATAYFSYLGMSVQISNIISGRRTFVAGAPRSSFTGQVLLFEMTDDDGLTVDRKHYLTGEQFGSGFGYSVVAADFNADGRDDLVVGAPFYHHSAAGPASAASASAAVGGIAYVYINSEQGIHSSSRPIRLFGRRAKDSPECHDNRCLDARFGMTVAAIGDGDQDGYEDLAIGAPFEGAGVVYIFRGSLSGLNRDFSQRISASDLPPSIHPLQSFGYSVSGRIDLDNNGYPDLLVGAYSSDAVLGLWMRPVVDVVVSVDHRPPLIDPRLTECPIDRLPFNCFQLVVCFEFKRRSQKRFQRDRPLFLEFSLQAEKTSDAYSRIFFPPSYSLSSTAPPASSVSATAAASSSSVDVYTYNDSIRLDAQGRPSCSDIAIYITPSNKDFLNQVKSVLTYRISDRHRLQDDEPSSWTEAGSRRTASAAGAGFEPPTLDEVMSNEEIASNVGIEHSVDFLKNCGDDSKCEANLRVHGALQLDKDEIGQYVLRSGQEQEMNLFVRITNRQEDAHETILTVLIPEYLKYRGTGRQYSCTPSEGAVHCAIGNPLPSDQEASFALRLDASNVDYSINGFEIKLIVNTTSIEVDEEDNEDVLKVKVILETEVFVKGSSDPPDVFYGGEVVGESATNFLEEIGPVVKHSYEVKNLGGSKSPSVEVEIRWPYELESRYPMGKHLLYLTDPPQVEGNRTTCVIEDESLVNPLQLKSAIVDESNTTSSPLESINFRVRRSGDTESNSAENPKTEAATARSYDVFGKTIKTVKLDCDLGTAKCLVVRCKIDRIEPGNSVVISLLSRLWKSTFVEDYRNVDHVRISSKAQLYIEFNDNIRQLSPLNATDKATTVALPDIGLQEVHGVPLWIIIVSVIVGVLFLAFFIWILWKCGFFKRKRGVNMTHKATIEKPDYHYNLLQHSTVTMAPRPTL